MLFFYTWNMLHPHLRSLPWIVLPNPYIFCYCCDIRLKWHFFVAFFLCVSKNLNEFSPWFSIPYVFPPAHMLYENANTFIDTKTFFFGWMNEWMNWHNLSFCKCFDVLILLSIVAGVMDPKAWFAYTYRWYFDLFIGSTIPSNASGGLGWMDTKNNVTTAARFRHIWVPSIHGTQNQPGISAGCYR